LIRVADRLIRPRYIALYEAGLDEADIIRQGGHAPSSVGTYIRDYERVKLMLAEGTPVGRIAPLLEMQPSVVRDYVAIDW